MVVNASGKQLKATTPKQSRATRGGTQSDGSNGMDGMSGMSGMDMNH